MSAWAMGSQGSRVSTIGEFLERAIVNGVKPSTVKTYRHELSALETWAAGGMKDRESIPLLEASERNLQTLLKHLHGMKSGRHSAALARMYFKAAGRPDLVQAFESRNWQRARRLQSDEILTLPDVNLILQSADTVRDRALVAVLWATGARIHEALALNLAHVKTNPEKTAYSLDFYKVKVQGEEHKAWVTKRDGSDYLKAWIAVHPDKRPDAPLFPSIRGGRFSRLSRGGARRMLQRAASRAGLSKTVYPHLFRHSRATHLLRLGLSEANVKSLIGWVPGSAMLGRYAHLAKKDAHRAYLEAVGEAPEADPKEAFGEIVSPDTLAPVVPMKAGPGALTFPEAAHAAESVKDSDLLMAILRRAMTDPAALETLRAALLQPPA